MGAPKIPPRRCLDYGGLQQTRAQSATGHVTELLCTFGPNLKDFRVFGSGWSCQLYNVAQACEHRKTLARVFLHSE